MIKRLLFFSLILAGIFLSTFIRANDAEVLFEKAQLLYDSKNYSLALPLFEEATILAPLQSSYHHMLGKCYGRLAEEGGWLTALRNVSKTLREFKIAVELDQKNVQALQDLEEFYRRAPGFLGGSKAKANEIEKKLSTLQIDRNVDNLAPSAE
jgi:tetratricopeptide (TPR) repeat protein